jgi:hypothetical protein
VRAGARVGSVGCGRHWSYVVHLYLLRQPWQPELHAITIHAITTGKITPLANSMCPPVPAPCSPAPVPAGRIFEFVHGEDSAAPLLGPSNLPQVVEALLMAIRDAPHIAEKVGGWGRCVNVCGCVCLGGWVRRHFAHRRGRGHQSQVLLLGHTLGWACCCGCHTGVHDSAGCSCPLPHTSLPHYLVPSLPPPGPTCPLQVCYAISQLAGGFGEEQRGTSPMSPYFKDVVQALLETVGVVGCDVLCCDMVERMGSVLGAGQSRAGRGAVGWDAGKVAEGLSNAMQPNKQPNFLPVRCPPACPPAPPRRPRGRRSRLSRRGCRRRPLRRSTRWCAPLLATPPPWWCSSSRWWWASCRSRWA